MDDKKRKLIHLESENNEKDDGESLHSNEESGYESEEEASPVMNDLISLLVEPGDDDWHVVPPEYTHQLFDEEKADFLQKTRRGRDLCEYQFVWTSLMSWGYHLAQMRKKERIFEQTSKWATS